jgi:protein-S-isoprenylcysteine O-methyltransferase Ste14
MSLVSRWTDLIYKVATGSRRVQAVLAPIVGVSYLGLIILFVVLSRAVDRWLEFPKVVTFPAGVIIGLCLIVLGFFLMIFSMIYFVRVKGTPVPFSPPPTLVVIGPYRFSRNPMVTGIFIQLFGIAIAIGSLSLACIFTPLFIIVNVWELKRVEEPELKRRLGDTYVKYMKEVPMFFPFFKKIQ